MYAVIFFVLLFRVTPWLVVAVQPCMQWIPIKRKPFTRPSILDFCDKAKAFPIFGCSKNTLFHIWFFRGFATSQTDMHCICATNHHDLYHERVGLLPPVAFIFCRFFYWSRMVVFFSRPSILDFCDKAKAFPIFGCSKNTLFHIWFFRGFATSQTDMHCICATNHHDLYHERVGLLPPVAFIFCRFFYWSRMVVFFL